MSDSWGTPKFTGLTEKIETLTNLTNNLIELQIKNNKESLDRIGNVLESYKNSKAYKRKSENGVEKLRDSETNT